MEDIKYEGLMGILSEIKKDTGIIRADSKAKENQQVSQSVSKEEIDAIVKDKVTTVANYIELRLKQHTENQTKILTAAINGVDKKIETLPVSANVSFPQPKKITFFGFEFLRTSVVIFSLSLAIFWSLTANIKHMDDYRALKIQLYQQTEYILYLEEAKEEQMKSKKGK